jgi:hypothetical protein
MDAKTITEELVKQTSVFLLVTLALCYSTALSADSHNWKTVTAIQPPSMNAACVYFQLAGVTVADDVQPGNPRFVVPENHTGYKEAYALLLAARLTGTLVSVNTTNRVADGACGNYASVAEVYFPS